MDKFLASLPIMQPPAGRHAFNPNDESLVTHLRVTSGICLSLAVVAVTARTFTKAWIMKKMEIEDCGFCQPENKNLADSTRLSSSCDCKYIPLSGVFVCLLISGWVRRYNRSSTGHHPIQRRSSWLERQYRGSHARIGGQSTIG